MAKKTRATQRKRRHLRVRKFVSGTPERPRLNIYRSNNGIYAQVIDDESGHTIASASTIDREIRDQVADLNRIEQARLVGEKIAERAMEKGVNTIVFDRGGFKYIGRVKALADGARSKGLIF